MKKLSKINKLGIEAFKNAIRLHFDSIKLFQDGSLPSAYALSILSQEEIGKSFLMAEVMFQDVDSRGMGTEYANIVLKSMLSHRTKQGWFSRQADDIFKYHGNKYPKIVQDISSGKLDEEKQNAIYVGVTKTNNKIDLLNGKVIVPVKRVKPQKVSWHITRVNDLIVELSEGIWRDLTSIDLDGIEKILTLDLVKKLEKLWPIKSRSSITKLRKFRKFEISTEYD